MNLTLRLRRILLHLLFLHILQKVKNLDHLYFAEIIDTITHEFKLSSWQNNFESESSFNWMKANCVDELFVPYSYAIVSYLGK